MSILSRATMVITRSMSRNMSAIRLEDLELKDQPGDKLFVLKLNDLSATVEYERKGSVYDLVHSSIPNEYKGKGYGKILAEKTFDYIADNNLKMKITCEFLMSCYVKNPNKYKKFVVE